jgi:hypothetical protein
MLWDVIYDSQAGWCNGQMVPPGQRWPRESPHKNSAGTELKRNHLSFFRQMLRQAVYSCDRGWDSSRPSVIWSRRAARGNRQSLHAQMGGDIVGDARLAVSCLCWKRSDSHGVGWNDTNIRRERQVCVPYHMVSTARMEMICGRYIASYLCAIVVTLSQGEGRETIFPPTIYGARRRGHSCLGREPIVTA